MPGPVEARLSRLGQIEQEVADNVVSMLGHREDLFLGPALAALQVHEPTDAHRLIRVPLKGSHRGLEIDRLPIVCLVGALADPPYFV